MKMNLEVMYIPTIDVFDVSSLVKIANVRNSNHRAKLVNNPAKNKFLKELNFQTFKVSWKPIRITFEKLNQ